MNQVTGLQVPHFQAHLTPEQQFWLARFSGDTRYAYAVARVRGWERALLGPVHYTRLLETPDWQSLLHALQAQLGYRELTGIREPTAVAEIVFRQFRQRMDELMAMFVHRRLRQTLMGFQAFDRLKTQGEGAAKSASGGEPHFGALQEAEKEIQNWRRNGRPQAHIELLAETLQFRFLIQGLRASGLPFLQTLARLWADVLAIHLILRWQWWKGEGSPWEYLPAEGFLDRRQLSRLVENPAQATEQYLKYSPYAGMLRQGVAALRSHASLWGVEQAAHQLLSRLFSLTRYTAFGPEPLVAYWWFYRQQYFNLNLILHGRLAGLTPKSIKPRLRLPYEQARLST
ncbi:MAG: hypothetical protein D6715_00830 [Calditrichaeota bacterium]|nr:MAG: hypothetical protein D6715_00830 [Calditrichota bacterium]